MQNFIKLSAAVLETEKKENKKKLCDNAENNTVVATEDRENLQNLAETSGRQCCRKQH